MSSFKCLTVVGRFVQKEYQNKVHGDYKLARARSTFLSKKSPLGEDDGYLTDDISEEAERHFMNDESSETHSVPGPCRQLLWYIDQLIQDGRPSGLKFNNFVLPTVLKMYHTIGEDQCEWFNAGFWPKFDERWRTINEDTARNDKLREAERKITNREGTQIMCAMILYQVRTYLQGFQKIGYTLSLKGNDERTYKFKSDDFNKCIWYCLYGDQRMIGGSTMIDDAFLIQIMEKWSSGQTLSSSITKE